MLAGRLVGADRLGVADVDNRASALGAVDPPLPDGNRHEYDPEGREVPRIHRPENSIR
jgi:hypothetical protein